MGSLAYHRAGGASCRFAGEIFHDWMTAQMGMRLALRPFKRENRKLAIILGAHSYAMS